MKLFKIEFETTYPVWKFEIAISDYSLIIPATAYKIIIRQGFHYISIRFLKK